MKKFLAILFAFTSFQVLADYECSVQLSDAKNLSKVIGNKTISIRGSQIRSGEQGKLFADSQIRVDISAYMNGWVAEEEVSIVMTQQSPQGISKSEKFSLRGNSKLIGWFANYKLFMSCEVKGMSPKTHSLVI